MNAVDFNLVLNRTFTFKTVLLGCVAVYSRWWLSACRRNLPAPSSGCLYPEDGAADSTVTLLAICQTTRRHIAGGPCENLRSHTVRFCWINDVICSWLSHGSCICIKAFPIHVTGCNQSAYTLIGVRVVIGRCVDFFERLLKPFISEVLNRALVWCCWNTGDPLPRRTDWSAVSAGYAFLTRVFRGLFSS